MTHTSARDSQTLTGQSVSLLWGRCSFLLGPGEHKALFVPSQESVPPVLWNFCSQIPLAFKVRFPGDAQSFRWIPRLGNLLWALLWYHCSPDCGLSTQWLYRGTKGDLLQEVMPHAVPPRSAEAGAPVPWQATAEPCLRRRHSKAGLAQSLLGVIAPFPGSWYAQACLCPLSISDGSEV